MPPQMFQKLDLAAPGQPAESALPRLASASLVPGPTFQLQLAIQKLAISEFRSANF